MDTAALALVRALPAFARELEALVGAAEPALAWQVPRLQIHDRCRCGQRNCATFYTTSRPEGEWPRPHRNVMLDSTTGFIVLDVVAEAIVCVEVLDRDDVKAGLDAALARI